MTPEEAIKIVKAKANLRTRYEGQEAFLDEVLVAEIERLMAARDEVESTVLNSLHHIGWQWLEDRFTESKSPLHQRLSMVIHAMADHHNSYKTTLL